MIKDRQKGKMKELVRRVKRMNRKIHVDELMEGKTKEYHEEI